MKQELSLLRTAAAEGRLLVFVGAGLSADRTARPPLPSGPRLAREIAATLGLRRLLKSRSLEEIAEIAEVKLGRARLLEAVGASLKIQDLPSEGHRLIAELPCNTIVTTNYDSLLERALEDAKRPFRVILSASDLLQSTPREVRLFKIHGDLSSIDEMVITERDYYSRFLLPPSVLVDALRSALASNVCLFVGYSIRDINLKYLFFELISKVGVESLRGRFYAVQLKASEADQAVWISRGLSLIVADQVRFLRRLVDEVEFHGLRRQKGSLLIGRTAQIGKVPLDVVRSVETTTGVHGQRFILFSRRKMEYLKVREGTWVQLIRHRRRNTIVQYAKAFEAPMKGAPAWLPLVMRHLLDLKDESEFAGGRPGLTIRRWRLTRVRRLEVRYPDVIFHSQPTLENLDNPDLAIAIRALEFERLGLKHGQPIKATSARSSDKAIVGQACLLLNNPGRAMLALGNTVWDFLMPSDDPNYWIIIERV